MLATLKRDIEAIKERDPAVRNTLEMVLAYPGFHAVLLHRVAHWLWQRQLLLLARVLSHVTRLFTGVEIHPGAQLGAGVFIDHGMGVVIGETAVVGNDVTLYQGVVLGGTGKEKGKRHPTIEDGVVIACGAKVLGSFTVGKNARIGAGAVVLRSVPANSTVVGVPGRVVIQDGQRVDCLDHAQVPDPVDRYIQCLQGQIASLQSRMNVLEQKLEETNTAKQQQFGKTG